MKKMKKENTIIASALKLFSENGFYNTTVSQVAKNLKMSTGNIYNYFPSKTSLARASIVYVAKKLAIKLKYINEKKISSHEKVYLFVKSYLEFLNKHPEMISYFFKVYLGNRELFCDNEDCGFELAKEFIKELENMIQDGIKSKEFRDQDFYISFSCVIGILGGITFLNSEKVLTDKIERYADDLSVSICRSIAY